VIAAVASAERRAAVKPAEILQEGDIDPPAAYLQSSGEQFRRAHGTDLRATNSEQCSEA